MKGDADGQGGTKNARLVPETRAAASCAIPRKRRHRVTMSKLYFQYGPMDAGKSAILLQSAHNYEARGMCALRLKPAIDTRDPRHDHIVSRIGLNAKATTFSPDDDIAALIVAASCEGRPVDCVFIDEAQFLTRDQVQSLAHVVDAHDIPIVCYGLRTDFRGELFEGSAALLALADDLEEIRTICWCGRKATMTLRHGASSNDAQVAIGGNEAYVSLCRRHWRSGQVCAPRTPNLAVRAG